MTTRLLLGDCLESMRSMPDNSVDALVTDPPAGIGFMGKAWDGDKGGRRQWVAWLTEVLAEARRVVKPGGHALVWALPRTSHWTGWAAEDAGWEHRDVCHHAFWCLDEDTEILTEDGWMRYNSDMVGSRALCFDVETGDYQWGRIDAQPVFDFDGVAVRIHGAGLDHIVTPSHRCVVERGDSWGFDLARNLAQEREAHIPMVEDLQGVLGAVRGAEPDAGGSQYDLLPGVSHGDDGGQTEATTRSVEVGNGGVRRMWNAVRAAEESARHDVLAAVQREGEGSPIGSAPEPRHGGNDSGGYRQAFGEDARREQPGVEGRRLHNSQAGQLPEDGTAGQVPASVRRDGALERLRSGASPSGGYGAEARASSAGSGASHQPRPDGQQGRESGAVCVEPRPQVARGARHTRSALVRCEPVAYTGKVWCVSVPTGAFVARKNGVVFVTGNSGFPKGGSIGPRIDKMAGAEREVVGTRPGDPARFKAFKEQDGNERTTFGADLTAPATPEAAKWEGWHTHLKPAVEHWHLLRKPLAESSIARQVLATGTGALHVDACRFAQGDSAWPGPQESADTRRPSSGGDNGLNGSSTFQIRERRVEDQQVHPGGRYPANLVHFPKPSRAEKERGCEVLPVWTGAEAVGRKEGSAGIQNPMAGAGRTATELRNHHPTPKPIALMRWLVRLVTPPGGTVLDCFMGSGTTGVAAKLEGFDFIGCELSPEYIDIARARIKHAAPGQEVEGGTDHEPEGAWQPGLFG